MRKKQLKYLKKQGYITHNAVVDGESIIIEGDIIINIQHLLSSYEKFQSLPQSKQALINSPFLTGGGKIHDAYVDNITLSLDPGLLDEWFVPLLVAIERYNNVNQCKIKMEYTNSNGEINISYKTLTGIYAQAEPPLLVFTRYGFRKKPGTFIQIDPANTASLEFYEKIELLLHEIGHNIGFEHVFDNAAHLNSYIANGGNYDGVQIQGTNLYDPNSVMSLGGFSSGGSFSVNDIIALQKVYPGPFISDFNQTINGPAFAIVGDSVTYTTSANEGGNTYLWQVKYASSSSWITISRESTARFTISYEATPNGINTMGVRCFVTKSNGDQSRKTISTTVEGNPTDGGHPN